MNRMNEFNNQTKSSRKLMTTAPEVREGALHEEFEGSRRFSKVLVGIVTYARIARARIFARISLWKVICTSR